MNTLAQKQGERPSAVTEIRPRRTIARTYWRDPSLPKWIGVPVHTAKEKEERLADERLEMVADERHAHFVSSLCENGQHAPAIDCDFPVTSVRLSFGWTRVTLHMSAPQRYHLHGRRLEPDAWDPIFDLLADLGWVKHELCTATVQDVTLVFGVPTRVLPSSSAGCFHLYIDACMPWGRYSDLLGLFFVAGVMGGHSYPWAKERGQTMLLRPGLSKARVRTEVQLDMFGGKAVAS
jgi:hypothetical protein